MNHSELAHKWAHAAPDASRRCGSMSFAGDTLYSYGTPIAKIYRNERGAMVLFSSYSYSVSTAKHIGHGRRAVSHLPALDVPRYIVGAGHIRRYIGSGRAAEDHAANLAHFTATAAKLLKAAQRAQRGFNVEWRRFTAREALAGFARYCAFFGIRRKAPAFPELEWNAAAARVERIENPDPASMDKRERAKAARKAAQEVREKRARELAAVHTAAARSDWRLCGAFGVAKAAGYGYGEPVMLRIVEDEIQTSRGARVPLAAAPMVWNLVQRARRRGKDCGWVDGGWAPRFRIGDYPLDRIDADGTLHAGCHTIPYSELAAMARALGLQS